MSEARLWEYIRDGIGHSGHFDRIESIMTVKGRPDVNYCIDSRIGDIELKIFDPRKGGFVIRPAQVTWFRTRVKAGGRCCVIARYNYPGSTKKLFLYIPGENVPKLAHDKTLETWMGAATQIWEDSINWSMLKAMLKGQ